MPSPIRIDIPYVVYEETFRCQQSRFLLLPEDELNDLIMGAMGRGQFLYPNVRLHDFQYQSNHGHRLISSTDGVSRSKFSQYVNQRISFEAGRRYGWKDGIFSRPSRPIVCVQDEDQLARFRYIRSHGLKENLVEKAEDWPGATALPFLRYGKEMEGTFVWHDRETKAKRRSKEPIDLSEFKEVYPVRLSKLPALEHLSWEEIHKYTDTLTKELEESYAKERSRPVLGRDAILAQHPHSAPRKTKRSPAPIVHCKDRTLRKSFKKLRHHLTKTLRKANREAQKGKQNVVFPPFCYPARKRYVSWGTAMGERTQIEASQVEVPQADNLGSLLMLIQRSNAPPVMPTLLMLLVEVVPLLQI